MAATITPLHNTNLLQQGWPLHNHTSTPTQLQPHGQSLNNGNNPSPNTCNAYPQWQHPLCHTQQPRASTMTVFLQTVCSAQATHAYWTWLSSSGNTIPVHTGSQPIQLINLVSPCLHTIQISLNNMDDGLHHCVLDLGIHKASLKDQPCIHSKSCRSWKTVVPYSYRQLSPITCCE